MSEIAILLILPFVLVNEILDALMAMIPDSVWEWMWKPAVETQSGELASLTDTLIRIVLLSVIAAAVAVIWWWA